MNIKSTATTDLNIINCLRSLFKNILFLLDKNKYLLNIYGRYKNIKDLGK